MAKRRAYLRGEAVPPVAQEDLGTGAEEFVLKQTVNAMLLGLKVGAAVPLPECGVVHVQFEALLSAVEVGVVARAAAVVQGDDGMTTGHFPIRTFAAASALSSARGDSSSHGP